MPVIQGKEASSQRLPPEIPRAVKYLPSLSSRTIVKLICTLLGPSKGDGDDRLALLLPFAGKRSSSWPIKLPLFNDFFSPFPSLVAFTFARPSERAQNSDEINCMNVVKKQHNTEIIHSRQIENDDVARTYSLLRRHV